MSANVETMFYTGRTAPWHGLGTSVEVAPTSKDALHLAGLDWRVGQENLYTNLGELVPGYKVNVREDNKAILGVVTDKYKVVQNEEAFAFTDMLLDHGVQYETAGSLNGGRRIWLLAKLPDKYKLVDEEVDPYIVFSNCHDGTGAIKVACTPVRVVCQNTLNLALDNAKRIWTVNHVGNMESKLEEVRSTLFLTGKYMGMLSKEAEELSRIKLTDKKVYKLIDDLIKIPDNVTETQQNNILKIKGGIFERYFDAPDLTILPKNAWRFINAVSDFATHAEPLRRTSNYRENLFAKPSTAIR